MTTAAEYDITIDQGSHFHKRFTWKDKDGNLINLTGYTARMQIRPAPNRTPIYVNLTSTANGGITLGGAAGTIDVDITHEETTELDFNNARYDLEVVAPSGRPTRLLQGKATLSHEVTE